MTITVVLIPTEDGGFTAFIPTLPGCISEGENRVTAMENIHKSIELYLKRIGDDEIFEQNYELVELLL